MAHKFLKDILLAKKEGLDRIDTGKDTGKAGTGKRFVENISPGRVNIIAEIKKASPSRGMINPGLDVGDTAGTYERFTSFISGISVLTEEKYFRGESRDIGRVKEAAGLPILRKDFIFSQRQVYESAVLGADCILLIKPLLGFNRLKQLYEYAGDMGLDVLVEVHHKKEFMQALEMGARLIGINNRDLKRMEVDRDHALSVLENIPGHMLEERIIICESGVEDPDYIERLYIMGINTFLIGTYFMKSSDLEKTLSRFGEELAGRGLI